MSTDPMDREPMSPHRALVEQRHRGGVQEWAQLATALADPELVAAVESAGTALVAAMLRGHTLLVCGNGGSAAMSSHIAAEFLGKCIADRSPLPAVSLAESTSVVTAVGNDYGFDDVFVRGVEAFGRPGDVLLAMSTSGTSANVVRAARAAADRGLLTIAMTGHGGGELGRCCDHSLAVPSRSTPRIQEVHLLWAHTWCEAIDLASVCHGSQVPPDGVTVG